LGTARNLKEFRERMEAALGLKGEAIRMEKVRHVPIEGKSSQGCPIAKWIIRRSSDDEKVLFVVKHRTGHVCEHAWMVISIVIWEGVKSDIADKCYDIMSKSWPTTDFR